MIKPFVGFVPYGESDSAIFFGRDDDARVILANLRASRLTILYGESGVGKTSLLNAKVAPLLRKEDGFPSVTFAAWSTDPAGQIRRAIASALGSENTGEGTIASCILERATRIKGRLLLVLDQFEEYFQYRTRQPDTFLEQFSELVVRENVPVNVLIAIREDALSSLDVFQDSIPQLFDNYLRLEHLSSKSAQEAIEGPIAAYVAATGRQIRLEDGLSSAVIKSISGQAERVPGIYLQLVMSALWDHDSEAGLLRISTLERLGGAHRIFETHFGTTIQERLDNSERAIAERMFTSLVTSSGRKQVQTLSDIGGPDEREEAHAVLKKLRDARILAQVPAPLGAPPEEPAYEFVHDVLARAALEWRRARSLELERKKAAMERRTAQKFRVLTWSLLAALVLVLIFGAITFLTIKERQKSEKEAAATERQSFEDRKKLLDEQQAAQVKAQKAIEAAAGKEAIARAIAQTREAATKLAQLQARESLAEAKSASARADVEATIARAAKLVLHGNQLLSQGGPTENQAALALAIYAVGGVLKVNQPASAEAEELLRAAASANSTLQSFEGNTSPESGDISWSPDGRKLYVPTIDSVVSLDREILQKNVKAAVWNQDGSRLAFATRMSTVPIVVTLVEESTGKSLGTRELTGMYQYKPVKWNVDLTSFVAQSLPRDGGSVDEVAIWSSFGNSPPVLVRPFTGVLSRYDWSPDGSLILIQGSELGSSVFSPPKPLSVKILRPSGEPVATLPPIETSSTTDVFVSWSPDNRPITVSKAGRIDIFDSKTGQRQNSLEVDATPVGGPIAVNPKNSRYLAFPSLKTVVVWDSERKLPASIIRTAEIVTKISWSPDGTKLAVLSRTTLELHSTDFALLLTQSELLEVARRYLKKDFRFSERECRQYFDSSTCPAFP